MAWVEGLSIVKGTSQRDLVHRFADYCIGPQFMYDVFKSSGYYPASTAPKAKMTKQQQIDSKLADPELPNKQHYYATPPNLARWEEVWNQVKAA